MCPQEDSDQPAALQVIAVCQLKPWIHKATDQIVHMQAISTEHTSKGAFL